MFCVDQKRPFVEVLKLQRLELCTSVTTIFNGICLCDTVPLFWHIEYIGNVWPGEKLRYSVYHLERCFPIRSRFLLETTPNNYETLQWTSNVYENAWKRRVLCVSRENDRHVSVIEDVVVKMTEFWVFPLVSRLEQEKQPSR